MADGPLVTVATVLLFSLLWPAAANVPLTYMGHVLGPTIQRTEVGVLENLFLVGDGIGASSVGYLAVTWTLPTSMLVIPSAAILLAGVLFAVTYGIRPTTRIAPLPESP